MDGDVKFVELIGERSYSSTQSVKTLLIEKEGKKYISIQKWWRKSVNEPWQEGKGFHLTPKEAEGLRETLEKAILSLNKFE